MKTTKAQRQTEITLKREIEKASKVALLQKISREACWIQNAEYEGNDLVAHVECALADESEAVQKYFRVLGFSF